MKIFAALGAGVCLLAIPAGSALANSSLGSNSLPGLPTLNNSSSHGGSGFGQSHSSGPSHDFHHADWRGHDWGWLKHRIVDFCRRGHGWGHGGFGWDDGYGRWGDGDRGHDRCHPHHPTSP